MSDEIPQNTSEADSPPRKKLPFWIDFGPLLIFFGAFHYLKRSYPDDALIWSAGVLAIAAVIALIYAWLKYKHTSPILIFSTVVIGGFALAAFIFDDKRFVFMKPTVMNGVFGVAVLGGVIFKKNVIKMFMGSAFELPDPKWNVLAIRWAFFFFAMAILNELIWRNLSENFWANFKVFGFFPLTILFTLTQIPFLMKYGKCANRNFAYLLVNVQISYAHDGLSYCNAFTPKLIVPCREETRRSGQTHEYRIT